MNPLYIDILKRARSAREAAEQLGCSKRTALRLMHQYAKAGMVPPVRGRGRPRVEFVTAETRGERDSRQFWLSKSVTERLAAMETIRDGTIEYVYPGAPARLERVCRVIGGAPGPVHGRRRVRARRPR